MEKIACGHIVAIAIYATLLLLRKGHKFGRINIRFPVVLCEEYGTFQRADVDSLPVGLSMQDDKNEMSSSETKN